MEGLVADASVVVKWFVEETDHPRARDLRNAFLAGRLDLASPSLLPYEVLNALRYSGVMKPATLQAAAEALDKASIPLYPLEGSLAKEALALAASKSITIDDASYAAVARILGRRLVTADEQLIEALGDTVDVVHIRDWTRREEEGGGGS